jgi:simple sugar transport system permease protein/ribose transport system permease protein
MSAQGLAAGPTGGAPALRRVVAAMRHDLASIAVVVALVALFVVAGIVSPAFLTIENILVIVRQASITGIVALGLTFVTISGSFFALSLEQTAAFCAVTFAAALGAGWGLLPSIVVTLALAAGIGVAQGGVVSLGLNPIIATLGFGSIVAGATSIATDNKLIRITTTEAEWLGSGRPLGIPTQSWAFVILIVLSIVVFRKSRFGRLVKLVGANREAARATGLVLAQVRILAFTLAALGAGIVGIFTAAHIGQGNVIQFVGLNIDAIAAVLVGGTAVQGGQGSMTRTALGALFIATLTNFMLVNNWHYGVRITVLGLAVVSAATLFHLMRSRRT